MFSLVNIVREFSARQINQTFLLYSEQGMYIKTMIESMQQCALYPVTSVQQYRITVVLAFFGISRVDTTHTWFIRRLTWRCGLWTSQWSPVHQRLAGLLVLRTVSRHSRTAAVAE